MDGLLPGSLAAAPPGPGRGPFTARRNWVFLWPRSQESTEQAGPFFPGRFATAGMTEGNGASGALRKRLDQGTPGRAMWPSRVAPYSFSGSRSVQPHHRTDPRPPPAKRKTGPLCPTEGPRDGRWLEDPARTRGSKIQWLLAQGGGLDAGFPSGLVIFLPASLRDSSEETRGIGHHARRPANADLILWRLGPSFDF